jgi:hypothetical protein
MPIEEGIRMNPGGLILLPVLLNIKRGHIQKGGNRNIGPIPPSAAPLWDGKDESMREPGIEGQVQERTGAHGTDRIGRKGILRRKEQRTGSSAKIAETPAFNSLLMGSGVALDVAFDSDSVQGQQQ